jgi:hypothetical protein
MVAKRRGSDKRLLGACPPATPASTSKSGVWRPLGQRQSFFDHEGKSAIIYRLRQRMVTEMGRGVKCLQNRRDNIHNQAVAEAGAPVGNGAVESLCGPLQARLHASGQFWKRPGLTHLLRVTVLFRNRDELHFWN